MHEETNQDLINKNQYKRKDKFIINQFSNTKERRDPDIIRRMITRRNNRRNIEQNTTINANKTLNATLVRDSQASGQRVLSPIESRKPILSGIEQVHKARENSLVNKILKNAHTRVISPKANEAPRINQGSSIENDTSSHVSNMKKLRLQRNLMNSNSKQRTNNSTSTTSSPSKQFSPQGRLGRFIETIKK